MTILNGISPFGKNSHTIPQLKLDTWLSKILKKNVYSCDVNDALIQECDTISFLKQYEKPLFVFSKVGSTRTRAMFFLERSGFYLVDANVQFKKDVLTHKETKMTCEVCFSSPEDENAVVNIAKHNFIYSRFHLDPFIAKEDADLIKMEWVRNFYLGYRGTSMIVARNRNSIMGFLQLIQNRENLTIDLIAVDKSFQGKGVAKSMIFFAEKNIANVKHIYVGTQISNIPSIRLYETLGFKLMTTGYVFHYHHI